MRKTIIITTLALILLAGCSSEPEETEETGPSMCSLTLGVVCQYYELQEDSINLEIQNKENEAITIERMEARGPDEESCVWTGEKNIERDETGSFTLSGDQCSIEEGNNMFRIRFRYNVNNEEVTATGQLYATGG